MDTIVQLVLFDAITSPIINNSAILLETDQVVRLTWFFR
jgi:hypothetical protein